MGVYLASFAGDFLILDMSPTGDLLHHGPLHLLRVAPHQWADGVAPALTGPLGTTETLLREGAHSTPRIYGRKDAKL